MTATVRLVPEAGGEVLRLVLDRPERRNALREVEVDALRSALDQAAASEARALVVQGAGRAFCAGADFGYLRRVAEMPPGERATHLRGFVDLVTELVRFPLPTVAGVHGPCYGAGACLALACDHVVADDEGRLGLVFTRIGVGGGDVCATWLLARRVPSRTAWRLLADAAELDAGRARSLGLVDEVVAQTELGNTVLRRALAWARQPGNALADTKRAVLDLEGAGALLTEHAERALGDLVDALGTAAVRERLDVAPA